MAAPAPLPPAGPWALPSGRVLPVRVVGEAACVPLDGDVLLVLDGDVDESGEIVDVRLAWPYSGYDPERHDPLVLGADEGATVVIDEGTGRLVIEQAPTGRHQLDCPCDSDQAASQFAAWVPAGDVACWADVLASLPHEHRRRDHPARVLLWRGRTRADGAAVIERWTGEDPGVSGGCVDGRIHDAELLAIAAVDLGLPPRPSRLVTVTHPGPCDLPVLGDARTGWRVVDPPPGA